MGVPKIKDEFDEAALSGFAANEPDYGNAATLHQNILTYVVEEQYEKAVEELKSFLKKDSEYPQFKTRIERYIYHAVDLVHAIKAKRHFPGKNSLTMAKQQELMHRYHEHFKELQSVLTRIQQIQDDLRIEDVRSTRWVIGAIVHAIFAVIVMAFLIEVSRGLFQTGAIVADDLLVKTLDWLFVKLGL